jgi:hypothetical protein
MGMNNPTMTNMMIDKFFIDLTLQEAQTRHVGDRIEEVYQEVLAVRRDLFMMRNG